MSTTEKDIYRDTPVRLLGYANEVGESFRSIIGLKWVQLSYAIATLYVFADAADKGIKTWQRNDHFEEKVKKTVYITSDVLLWQMLASVIIPGFAINRVCAGSDYLIRKNTKIPKNRRNLIVIGVGLLSIPFIIKPIDRFVDDVLENSLRKIRWD